MQKRWLGIVILLAALTIALPISAEAAPNVTASLWLDGNSAKDGSDPYSLGSIYIDNNCTGSTFTVGDDITDWFSNLPEGLSVIVDTIEYNLVYNPSVYRVDEIGIKVFGTPTANVEEGDYEIAAVIPANTLYIDDVLYPKSVAMSQDGTITVVDTYTYIDHISINIDYSTLVFDGSLESLCNSWLSADIWSTTPGVMAYTDSTGWDDQRNMVYPDISVSPRDGYKLTEDCTFSINPDILTFDYDERVYFSANNGAYKGPFGFGLTTSVSYNYFELQVANHLQGLPSFKAVTFHSEGMAWTDTSVDKTIAVYETDLGSDNLSTLDLQNIVDELTIIDGFELIGWSTSSESEDIAFSADDLITYDDLTANETHLYARYICTNDALIAYGACGETMMFTLDNDGNMCFLGNGHMYRYEGHAYLTVPWKDYLDVIKSLYVAPGIRSLVSNAFRFSALETVQLPEGLEELEFTFTYAINLKEIAIPASVSFLHPQTFMGCTALSAIHVHEDNKDYSSVEGVLYNKDKTQLLTYPGGKQQTSFAIPSSVYALDTSAFMDNYHLEELYVHSGVNRFADYCFPYNSDLTIYFDGPKWEWDHLGNGLDISTEPSVVCSNTTHYMTGACGDNVNWKLTEDGYLIIAGTGAMWDYDENAVVRQTSYYTLKNAYDLYHQLPWGGMQNYVHTLLIEEGITHVGSCAFMKTEYLYDSFGTVILPSTLKSIGVFAFDYIERMGYPLWYKNTRYDGIECAFFAGSQADFANVTVGVGNCSVIGELHFGTPTSVRSLNMPSSLRVGEPLLAPTQGYVMFEDGSSELVTTGWSIDGNTNQIGKTTYTVNWLSFSEDLPLIVYDDLFVDYQVVDAHTGYFNVGTEDPCEVYYAFFNEKGQMEEIMLFDGSCNFTTEQADLTTCDMKVFFLSDEFQIVYDCLTPAPNTTTVF